MFIFRNKIGLSTMYRTALEVGRTFIHHDFMRGNLPITKRDELDKLCHLTSMTEVWNWIEISKAGYVMLTNGKLVQLEPFVFRTPLDLTHMNDYIDVAAGTFRDLRLVACSPEVYDEEMPKRFSGLPVFLEFGSGFPYQQHRFRHAIDEEGFKETAQEIAYYLTQANLTQANTRLSSFLEEELQEIESKDDLESYEGHEWGDYPSDLNLIKGGFESVANAERAKFTAKNPVTERAVTQQMIDRFDAGNRYTWEEAKQTFSHLLSLRGIRRAWESAREKRPPIGYPGRPSSKTIG